MRKIIVSNMISVDGYFAGVHEELDWHVLDKDFQDYAIGMLDSVDTLIFGKVTYDMMASFWSSQHALKADPMTAERMTALPKIVFSKTLAKVDWNNSKVLNDIDPAAISRMKNEPGKDMVILGSGTIVQQFTDLGLIDEYRLIVNPVALGNGKSLFKNIKSRLNLKLTDTKTLACGDVILFYQPKN